jgi:hypothetical protein
MLKKLSSHARPGLGEEGAYLQFALMRVRIKHAWPMIGEEQENEHSAVGGGCW